MKENKSKKETYSLVIVSDVHWEVRHKKAVSAVTEFIKDTKPDCVVLLGDIFDSDLLSTYPKKKKKTVVDLGDEIKDAVWWLNLISEYSKRVIFTVGNHEDRLQRMTEREPGAPSELFEFKHMFKTFGVSDKVEIFKPESTKDGILRIGKIGMIHGSKFGQYQAFMNITKEYGKEHCIVQGHAHRPQVIWWQDRVGIVNGHLSDKKQQDYCDNPQWTLGITLIELFDNFKNYNVHPLTINENGRFCYAGKVYKPKY